MKSCVDRYRENNSDQKIAFFKQKQLLSSEEKFKYAAIRAWEFYKVLDGMCYTAVGGLDSITLHLFLASIGIWIPGVSVSGLEDVSIQRIHKQLGIVRLKPVKKADGTHWRKDEVIKEFGFPVLSKEIAGKIHLLQNPSERNKTVRHAIITGETGEYGGNRVGTRMKMSQKWLEKFGGPENETEGTNYLTAPFRVSDKCCYYLKEKPCDDYARESKRFPYMGLMASEGGRRQKALMIHGCNYIGAKTKRSAPFAIFYRQDILELVLLVEKWLKENWESYRQNYYRRYGILLDEFPPKTIVPEIYGEIVRDQDGTLRTTKAQRTGCSMCGFGIHLEKRPHRFDRLREENYKAWYFWMYVVGWGAVLDYIGVAWEEHYLTGCFPGQVEMRI